MVYLGKRRQKKLSKKEAKAQKKQEVRDLELTNNQQSTTENRQQTGDNQQEKKEKTEVEIPKVLTVKEFANRLELPVTDVMKKLIDNGVMASINESIDYETATIIGDELGFDIKCKQEKKQKEEERSNLKPRPPIVVVLGHVDHGKTTLLDAIRKTNIVGGESGGITQHIGAYQVKTKNKKSKTKSEERIITFLDTPGHEAFSAMRAHGANITDIAILVVAADDGVKPQTKEAISHAKAAEIPIIVAINKIDKPEANIEKVERELADLGLNPEKWGGDTVMVPVSAKTEKGIDDLLEMVLLTADLIEPKAEYSGKMEGVVIESHMQAGLGPVATVLIRHGKLKTGDILIFGKIIIGKIKSIEDFLGKKISDASPAMPVKISGLTGVPNFGDRVYQVENEREAKNIINMAQIKNKQFGIYEVAEAIKAGILAELPIILKVDAQGSLEAIKNTLEQLGNRKVKVKIISAGIGGITESDVNMAVSGEHKALIIGFRVVVPVSIKKIAEEKGIKISNYDIIYRLIEDIQAALTGILKPEKETIILGKLEVLKVFYSITDRKVFGGKVIDGKIVDGERVNIYHSGEIIDHGKIISLEESQIKAKEVKKGHECGLAISTKRKIKVGDLIEVFKEEEKKMEL